MRNAFKLTAVAAVAALFTSLSACATSAPTPSSSLPPASPTTTAAAPSASASASASASQAAATLGPLGYGTLKLGATKAEAKATGLTDGISTSNKGKCGDTGDGWLKAGGQPDEDSVAGMLFFSANTGKLVAIYASGEVATPEGIKLGSTIAELKAAFGDWGSEDGTEGRGYEKVKGNSKASYRIVVNNGIVIELSLDSQTQDCYE